MINRVTITLLFIGLSISSVMAQEQEAEMLVTYIESQDMDNDDIADSLYYDRNNQQVAFLLSSRDFKPYTEKLKLEPNAENRLIATQGGFVFIVSYMRRSETYNYKYNSGVGRFELVKYYTEDYGNVVNDGSGMVELDLLSKEYTGKSSPC